MEQGGNSPQGGHVPLAGEDECRLGQGHYGLAGLVVLTQADDTQLAKSLWQPLQDLVEHPIPATH